MSSRLFPSAGAALLLAAALRSPVLGGSPNVILITLDALRADHLSCYGYPRKTTPNLDRLAEEGVRFEKAYVQAPWTLASLASLFTGRYPEFHGVQLGHPALSPAVPTFIQRLRDAGFQATAFVSGLPVEPENGLTRDFSLVRRAPDWRRSGELFEDASRWLRDGSREPFLLWIHAFDTHFPYFCPQPHREQYAPHYQGPAHDPEMDRDVELHGKFVDHYNQAAVHRAGAPYSFDPSLQARIEKLRASPKDLAHFADHYDGCLNYTDRQIGILIRAVRERGLGPRTVWIITSDHGEYLGTATGNRPPLLSHPPGDLYEDLLRVPLILKTPHERRLASVVSRPVMMIDIAPTVLELAGIPIPPGFQGESLLRNLGPEARDRPPRPVYASSFYPARPKSFWLWALRVGDWKLLRLPGRWQLFHLGQDPLEQEDLLEREPAMFLELSRAWLDSMTTAQKQAGSLY